MNGFEQTPSAPAEGQTALNTDRDLWRGTDPAGDYYADSCFLTDDDLIGFNVGGYCVAYTPREWVDLAWPPCAECGGRVGHIHWCATGRYERTRRFRIRAFFARMLRGVSR